MYQYTYRYEAYIESFRDMSLHLSDSYTVFSTVILVIFSLLAVGLTVLAALSVKRARVYGIITAVAQPVGLLAAIQMVKAYATIDFSVISELHTYSSVSLDDAKSKLYDQLAEILTQQILPDYITVLFWSCIVLAVFVITLVYIILRLKAKGKGLAVAAMILLIVRWLFISPVEQITLFLGMGSESIQTAWTVFYAFAFLLPLLLIGIQGLVNLKKGNAPAAVAVAEQSEEQPEELPAEIPSEE